GACLVPSSRDDHQPALDPLGALLSIAGLGTLIYAIIEAPARGWGSTPTVVTALLAIGILGLFAGWQLRADHPMLDLRFFRNPRFTAATATITLIFFVMFGMFFAVTQYLQSVLGYRPFEAGLRVVPWAGAYMVSAPLSARLVERWGQRRVVSTGFAVVAGGMASAYHADLVPRIQGLPAAARVAGGSLGSALQTATTLPRPAAEALGAAARQAYVHALDTTLLVAVAVALLASALVTWVLRP